MLDIRMLWSTLQDMTTTEPIDRLTEDEFPHDEVIEAAEIELAAARATLAAGCCNVIPCRNPEGCPR